MNGHQHIAEGEHELAVANTKPTYSEAAAQHVARATAHFTAAVARFLAETDPAELRDPDDEEQPVDNRPHSRICGISFHDHGVDCHPNCPTCHGVPERS
jgi:hypothetical protein